MLLYVPLACHRLNINSQILESEDATRNCMQSYSASAKLSLSLSAMYMYTHTQLNWEQDMAPPPYQRVAPGTP